MTSTPTRTDDHSNIGALRRLIQDYSPATWKAIGERVEDLQYQMDGRYAALRCQHQRISALETALRWVESEMRGLERALELMIESGEVAALRTGESLPRRLAARHREAREIGAEIVAAEERAAALLDAIAGDRDIIVAILQEHADIASARLAQLNQAHQSAVANAHRAAAGDVGGFEMWSPTPVAGFRAWQITEKGLSGAWTQWRSPQQTAECSHDGTIPHTDGRCAEVAYGCGIYAMKSIDYVLARLDLSGSRYAFGLVGLAGKVVEHDRGYRAAQATVLALAVYDRGDVRFMEGTSELNHFFSNPAAGALLGCIPLPQPKRIGDAEQLIRDYLNEQTRRHLTWTLDDPSA